MPQILPSFKTVCMYVLSVYCDMIHSCRCLVCKWQDVLCSVVLYFPLDLLMILERTVPRSLCEARLRIRPRASWYWWVMCDCDCWRYPLAFFMTSFKEEGFQYTIQTATRYNLVVSHSSLMDNLSWLLMPSSGSQIEHRGQWTVWLGVLLVPVLSNRSPP